MALEAMGYRVQLALDVRGLDFGVGHALGQPVKCVNQFGDEPVNGKNAIEVRANLNGRAVVDRSEWNIVR